MANLFTNLLKPFQTPTPVEKAVSNPMPVGVIPMPTQTLDQAIGQPHDYEYPILYGLYMNNTDVSGCVDILSGRSTSRGWRLGMLDDDTNPTDEQVEAMKELSRWLKRPNPYKTMTQLLVGVFQQMAIVGDAYWYVSRDKKGIPLEIWPMHPSITKVVANSEGEILGYVMQSQSGKKIVFLEEEVIHFQLPNPVNDLYGLGRVEKVVQEAGLDLQALQSNKSIFSNGMQPSVVLQLDDMATPDDAKRLTDELRQSHTGADNRHKILALARLKDVKPYSLTPKDLDFLGLRKLSTDKVTTGMGVPKVLLGNHNSGDYATTEFLDRNMNQSTIIPWQVMVTELITEKLIHSINPDFAFMLNEPQSGNPDRLRQDLLTAHKDGAITADELRMEGFDLEPLEESEGATIDPGAKDKAPGEFDEDDGNGKDAPEEVETDEETKKSLVRKSEELDPLAIRRDRLMDELEQDLFQPLAEHFTAQEEEYLADLDENLTADNLEAFIQRPTSAFNTAFGLLLGTLLLKPLQVGLGEAKRQLLGLGNLSEEQRLQIDMSLRFDQTNEIVMHYIRIQAFTNVVGINETTRNRLRITLEQGLRNGEGVMELAERIQGVYDAARGYRSTMIARSEVAQAFQYANHAAGEKLFDEGLVRYRRWLTAPEDGRVCDICLPLNRYTIRFDAQYPNGLEPSHVHPGCRCTEAYMVGDEAELPDWRRI